MAARSFLRMVLVTVLFGICFGCGGHTPQLKEGAVAPRAGEIVSTARSVIGKPYRFGGLSPEGGFDCSGFTWWVYHRNGINLPRQTADQMSAGRQVSKKDLRPGDLVFFDIERRGPSHVGIYTGDNRFVHCPSTGSCVREDRFSHRYWQRKYVGACRVLPQGPH